MRNFIGSRRYWALVNMTFNIGITRLVKFRKMWEAIGDDDWEKASLEALDSKWAEQVGNRAVEIAAMLREG